MAADHILTANNKIVVRDNKIVLVDDPADCDCCGPPPGNDCNLCESGDETMPATVSVTLPELSFGFANCLQDWCADLAGNYTLDQESDPSNACEYFACFDLDECDPYSNPLLVHDGIRISLDIESTRFRVRVWAFYGSCASAFTHDNWQWTKSRSSGAATCGGTHTLNFSTEAADYCSASGTTVEITI
jgi:hypothetical protein